MSCPLKASMGLPCPAPELPWLTTCCWSDGAILLASMLPCESASTFVTLDIHYTVFPPADYAPPQIWSCSSVINQVDLALDVDCMRVRCWVISIATGVFASTSCVGCAVLCLDASHIHSTHMIFHGNCIWATCSAQARTSHSVQNLELQVDRA